MTNSETGSGASGHHKAQGRLISPKREKRENKAGITGEIRENKRECEGPESPLKV